MRLLRPEETSTGSSAAPDPAQLPQGLRDQYMDTPVHDAFVAAHMPACTEAETLSSIPLASQENHELVSRKQYNHLALEPEQNLVS